MDVRKMDVASVFNSIKNQIDAVKDDSNSSFIEESLDSEWCMFEKFSESLFETAFNDKKEQLRVLSEIGMAKNNSERVKLIFQNESFEKLVNVFVNEFCSSQNGKNKEKSIELRSFGNKCYSQGKFQEALDKYNQAIDLAPYPKNEEEKELSLCFANRSAVFMHFHQYSDAFEDIKEAAVLNYPIDRTHVLAERLLQCMDFIHASKSLAEDLRHSLQAEDPGNILKEKILKVSIRNQSKSVNTTKRTLNTTIAARNEIMPNASSSTRMNFSADKGRFIEATKDIQPSEVLFAEKPYVQWLKPSYYKMFCGHCLKHLVYTRFVSCKNCSEIRFCSNECLQTAWEQYHRHECKLFHILKHLSLGALALKAILTATVDVALEQFSTNKEIASIESTSKQYRGGYGSVLYLVDHADKCQPNVVAALTTGAVFLACLGREMKIIDGDQMQQFAALILQHVFQFNCNTIAVLFDECEREVGYQTFNANVKPIAMAVYPTISLLNHSCYNQVYVLFNASQMTLKAVGNIKNGEEISFCYGPQFQKMTYKDRLEVLDKCFYFKCECKACVNKWENLGKAYLCTICNQGAVIVNDDKSNYCLRCNGSNANIEIQCQSVDRVKGLLTAGYGFLDENKVSEEAVLNAKCKYTEALALGEKNLYRANDLMIEINEKLADCHSQIAKHKKAMLFWFKCYELTKEVEGDDCNYDCMFYLLKITEALIDDTYSLTDAKEKPRIVSNVKKASSYFAKAVEVSQKLSGKEYKLLIARNEILQNMPVLQEIASRLHQLNVLFDKNI